MSESTSSCHQYRSPRCPSACDRIMEPMTGSIACNVRCSHSRRFLYENPVDSRASTILFDAACPNSSIFSRTNWQQRHFSLGIAKADGRALHRHAIWADSTATMAPPRRSLRSAMGAMAAGWTLPPPLPSPQEPSGRVGRTLKLGSVGSKATLSAPGTKMPSTATRATGVSDNMDDHYPPETMSNHAVMRFWRILPP